MNSKVRLLFVCACALIIAAVCPASLFEQNPSLPRSSKNVPPSLQKARIEGSYGKIPLSFEANRGQTDRPVAFLARSRGSTMEFGAGDSVLTLRMDREEKTGTKRRPAPAVVQMQLVGINHRPKVTGIDELPGKVHYYRGSNPKKWQTNIPTYAKLRYSNVYPGVDLIFYGNHRDLEYDFVLAPGADYRQIRLRFGGVDAVEVNDHGDLVLQTAAGKILQRKPLIYQTAGGIRREVAATYDVRTGNEVAFDIAPHDPTEALVIDPVLVYSSYMGGSGDDIAWGVAVDSAGNAYVTGSTNATLPSGDAWVRKINPQGSALLYSVVLGGALPDAGRSIAVDNSGNAYVTGSTTSSDFPVTPGAFQPVHGGSEDGFVTKLNSSGSVLYSSYLGGSFRDSSMNIAVDVSGNSYLTGLAYSMNFPTVNPLQAVCGSCSNGIPDAFVTKLNASGSALVYSTYLGGSSSENEGLFVRGSAITVDASGNAYVTGHTSSTNFPTVAPFQSTNAGGSMDAFLAKLNSAGSALLHSTYLGGSGEDGGNSVLLDSLGNIYLAGSTTSANFPTMNPYLGSSRGIWDGFLVKFNPSASALIYSTYFGGTRPDGASALAVDGSGNVYFAGQTDSSDLPTVDTLQPFRGNGDAYAAKLNASGSALLYSTFLGGTSAMFERSYSIALDTAGNAYVVGATDSSDFPVVNPFQGWGGLDDGFIVKISDSPAQTVEIQMSQTTYVNGEAATATEFRLRNRAFGQSSVEVKAWLGIPGLAPVSILNLGADGSFALVAGQNQNIGPLTLFTVDSSLPRGSYEFSSRVLVPVSGRLLSEDLNPFTIQ